MTPKAEKLARELVALRLRYGGSDFTRAIEIIQSGELFHQLLEAAHAVQRRSVRGGPQPKFRDKSIEKESHVSRARAVATRDTKLMLFLDKFLARESLPNSASVRAFAEFLTLSLPKKPPPREHLALLLVSELARLPEESRLALIEQADRLDNPESSLQLWSNVIVKRNAPDRTPHK